MRKKVLLYSSKKFGQELKNTLITRGFKLYSFIKYIDKIKKFNYGDLKKSKNEEAKYYFYFDENLVRFISEDGSINDNQEILNVIKNDLKDDYLMNIQNSK